MKVRYKATFEYGKNLAKYLLIAAVICGLVALLFVPNGTVAQMVLILASFALMIVLIVVIVKYCRCPYCNRVIAAGVLRVTSCPGCKRDLSTGKKLKKYQR